jgi:hypothetical protein
MSDLTRLPTVCDSFWPSLPSKKKYAKALDGLVSQWRATSSMIDALQSHYLIIKEGDHEEIHLKTVFPVPAAIIIQNE